MGPILDYTKETNLGEEKGTSVEDRESTNLESSQRKEMGYREENVLGESSEGD